MAISHTGWNSGCHLPPPPDREVKLLTGTEGANFYIDESDAEHTKEEEEIKKVSLFFTACTSVTARRLELKRSFMNTQLGDFSVMVKDSKSKFWVRIPFISYYGTR